MQTAILIDNILQDVHSECILIQDFTIGNKFDIKAISLTCLSLIASYQITL